MNNYVKQVLSGTESKDFIADYFAEYEFRPGTKGYIKDDDGNWQLAVYIEPLGNTVYVTFGNTELEVPKTIAKNAEKVNLAADCLQILDQIMPWGNNSPNSLLPQSLRDEVGVQLGLTTDSSTYQKVMQHIVNGDDALQDVLVSLSQYIAPVTEGTHVITHDSKNARKIFLGTVYSLESMEISEQEHVISFYNMTYSTCVVHSDGITITRNFANALQEENFGRYASFEDLDRH
jgi:hypothetical protein